MRRSYVNADHLSPGVRSSAALSERGSTGGRFEKPPNFMPLDIGTLPSVKRKKTLPNEKLKGGLENIPLGCQKFIPHIDKIELAYQPDAKSPATCRNLKLKNMYLVYYVEGQQKQFYRMEFIPTTTTITLDPDQLQSYAPIKPEIINESEYQQGVAGRASEGDVAGGSTKVGGGNKKTAGKPRSGGRASASGGQEDPEPVVESEKAGGMTSSPQKRIQQMPSTTDKTANADKPAAKQSSKTQVATSKPWMATPKTQATGSMTQTATSKTQATSSKTQTTAAKTQGTASKTQAAASKTQATSSKTQAAAPKTQVASAKGAASQESVAGKEGAADKPRVADPMVKATPSTDAIGKSKSLEKLEEKETGKGKNKDGILKELEEEEADTRQKEVSEIVKVPEIVCEVHPSQVDPQEVDPPEEAQQTGVDLVDALVDEVVDVTHTAHTEEDAGKSKP